MRSFRRGTRLPFVLYVAMLCAMFIMCGYLAVTADLENTIDRMNEGAVTDVTFYDPDGNIVENTLNLYEIGPESYVYFVVPDDLPENASFCFKIRHMYPVVSLENTGTLYEYAYAEDPLYTNSIGVDWVTIPLEKSYAGLKMYIHYRLAYDAPSSGFDHVTLVRPDGFILGVIDDRLGALVICAMYLAIGLMLVVVGLVARATSKDNLSLFWLGALAISVAAYCFLETQSWQIFAENSRLIHLCVMFALILIPLPAVAYIDCLLGVKPAWLVPVYTCTDVMVFVVSVILNLFDIVDYHDLLPLIHGLIVLAMLMLLIRMVIYIIKCVRFDKKVNIYTRAMIVGVASIIVTGFVDIVRYAIGAHDDAAATIRVGFLIFLLSFAVASSERVMTAFQSSARNKLISKLAYEDGLTGLGNRTAYQEAQQYVEEHNIRTGIVMMDVNNLKYVNDHMGHDDGDELLVSAANLIKSVFGNVPGAKCYRIGGDEFVVLIRNDDIEKSCEDGVARLRAGYRKFNDETDKHFKLVIAVGYSIFESQDDTHSFKNAADHADELMYSDKRELKTHLCLNVMV